MSADKGFKALATALIQRMNLATRGGLQFDGQRDLYKTFGYKLRPTFEDYFARYCRQDIASRIVDAPAQAVWRNPPVIEAPDEFITKWDGLQKKNKIYYNLERADRLAGLGLYSTLLIGFDDSAPLEQPASGAKDVLYLQPYSQLSSSIIKFNDNPKDSRYNLPEMYKLAVVEPASQLSLTQIAASAVLRHKEISVHHSRILHIADNILENDILGIPRLQQVYNLLDDILKVVGGSAETYWLNANRGMQLDVDKDMDLSVADAKALSDEIDEWQHQLRRVMRTRGIKMNPLGSDVADPTGPFNIIVSLISGATGIPQRILLGAEAGQLASEQDRANWAERVFERRGTFAEPVVLEPFIDLLFNAGVLPNESKDVEFNWPSAFHMSPLEQAQTSAQQARSVANLTKQGTKSNPVVITTVEESRVIVGLPEEGAPEQPSFEEEGEGEDGELDDEARQQLEDDDADGPKTNVRTISSAKSK